MRAGRGVGTYSSKFQTNGAGAGAANSHGISQYHPHRHYRLNLDKFFLKLSKPIKKDLIHIVQNVPPIAPSHVHKLLLSYMDTQHFDTIPTMVTCISLCIHS